VVLAQANHTSVVAQIWAIFIFRPHFVYNCVASRNNTILFYTIARGQSQQQGCILVWYNSALCKRILFSSMKHDAMDQPIFEYHAECHMSIFAFVLSIEYLLSNSYRTAATTAAVAAHAPAI
jgi:glycosylphosphatidylinositol transamidase (GPIT) subunit GPI8